MADEQFKAVIARPEGRTGLWRTLDGAGAADARRHAGGAPAAEASLLDYAALMLRHRRMILTAVGAALLLGLLYGGLAVRYYTATAALEVGGYLPTLTEAGVEQALRQESQDQKFLQTQVAKLRRLSLADFVLAKEDLSARVTAYLAGRRGLFGRLRDWLRTMAGPAAPPAAATGEHYRHSEAFLRAFLDLVKVEPVFATSLVELSATTTEAALSRDIANAYAAGFIEFGRGQRHGQVQESVSFLQTQADELGRKVAEAEREVAAYAEAHELLTLSNDESVVVREIAALTEKLSEASGRRIRSESMLHNVENNDGADSTILDDESIRAMRVELKRAEAEYQDMAQKVMPAYPPMQQLKAKIKALKGNVAEQRRQAQAALKTRYRSDLEAETALRARITELKQAAFKNSRERVRYNILKREYESLKDLHQSLLKQLKETQVASAGRASTLSIVEFAALPSRPSRPRRMLILAIALCAGVVLGIGWALIKDSVYGTVDEPEDVPGALQAGLLGVIPRFESHEAARRLPWWGREVRRLLPAAKAPLEEKPSSDFGGEDALITINIPEAGASEAFRTLRASILLSVADHPPRVILVSSALQGDGKTTVSSNLAVALAQAGHRTVVVDADLRRRRLQHRFNGGAAPGRGLSDYLTGQATLAEVARPSVVTGLTVIEAGSPAPNPAELVGSGKMGDLLRQLRASYEFVVLDSPPLLPVADAVMLSVMVDGVVLVVRSAGTERKPARRALAQLKQVQARVLGVVLNNYGRNTGPGYGYFDEDRAGEKPVIELNGEAACG